MAAIGRAVKGLQEITDMALAGDKDLENWGRMFNLATNNVNIAKNVDETASSDGSKQSARQESIRTATGSHEKSG